MPDYLNTDLIDESTDIGGDTPVAAPSKPEYAARLLQQGLEHRSQGEYDRAFAEFTSAIRVEPTAFAYACRGEVLRLRGSYEEALADLNRSLQIDPEQVRVYLERGLVHRLMGHPDFAVSDYSAGLARDPRNAAALNSRGLAQADRGDYEHAVADYTAALGINPQFFLAYLNRGKALAAKGAHNEAIVDFTSVLAADADNPQAYSCRAEAYGRQGRHQQAIADYTTLLRLQPNNALTYTRRGHAHRLQGELELAAADYAEALRLDPHNAEVYAHRGLVYRQEAKFEPAIADLKQALELDGDNIIAHYNLGKVHAALGNREAAFEEYSQALQLQPDFVPAYLARAVVVENGGRHDLALSDCNAALTIDPHLAASYYLRGTIHRHLGQLIEAAADLSRAIQLDPAFALAYMERAWVLANQGDYKAATADFSEAIRLDPQNSLAHASRSMVCQVTGDTRQAVADLSRACAIAPRLVLACWFRGLMRTIPEQYKEVIAAYTEGIRPAPTPPAAVPGKSSGRAPTETTQSSGEVPLHVLPQETHPPAPDDDDVLDVLRDDDILVELWEGGSNRHDQSEIETTELSGEAPLLELPQKTPPPAPDDDYVIEALTDDEILVETWEHGSKRHDQAEIEEESPPESLEHLSSSAALDADGPSEKAQSIIREMSRLQRTSMSEGATSRPRVAKVRPPSLPAPRRPHRHLAGPKETDEARRLRLRNYKIAASAVLAALVSCFFLFGGKSNGLYPVSGTVIYNGKPPVGAIVEFRREGANPLSDQLIMGVVEQDGSFTLSCGNIGEGAPPGEYAVVVKWPQQAKNSNSSKSRLADPKLTPLHAVVKTETNKLPPFELKD